MNELKLMVIKKKEAIRAIATRSYPRGEVTIYCGLCGKEIVEDATIIRSDYFDTHRYCPYCGIMLYAPK